MSLLAFCDKTVTLQRPTPARDAIGGNNPTWATATATAAGALWPANSAEARTFLRRDLVGSHVVAVASDLGVRAGDRLTVGGESGYFLVNGFEKYSNAAAGTETLYLIDATRRTVG